MSFKNTFAECRILVPGIIGICISMFIVLGLQMLLNSTKSGHQGRSEESREAPKNEQAKAVEPTPAEKIGIDEAIKQMSKRYGIPEERLRAMSPTELQQLADRFLTEKTGRPEGRSMSVAEKVDAAIQQVANKYGISYGEAKRFYFILEKMDSGQQLTSDEEEFVRALTRKIGR